MLLNTRCFLHFNFQIVKKGTAVKLKTVCGFFFCRIQEKTQREYVQKPHYSFWENLQTKKILNKKIPQKSTIRIILND